MTTLDTLIEQRLAEFDAKICGSSDTACKESLESEKIQYLLTAAPFIKEYMQDEEGVPTVLAKKTALDEYICVTNVSKRSEIFRRYLVEVEENPHVSLAEPEHQSVQYACSCGASRTFDTKESALVCESCGISVNHMEMSARNLTYNEEVSQITNSAYSYKRLNHMTEWLSSLQGKENCDIPPEVIDAVKREFKKQRINRRGEITAAKVRQFLKKLNLNKYYEHTNYITNLINGVPPPKLPQSLEDKIKTMFLMIQKPFEKHCPSNRKNFLSYSYTLHKLCQLLGEDAYLPYFGLLKSSQKLFQQDKIWKCICQELSWEFIPSV